MATMASSRRLLELLKPLGPESLEGGKGDAEE
jgi:hypothetical protein